MASWFTAEKLSALIRILSLIFALMSGVQAVQGYQIVANRPAGVAGATADQIAPIGGNAVLTMLLGLVVANKKLITDFLKGRGVPSAITDGVSVAVDFARLNDLWHAYKDAKNDEQRAAIRAAAKLISDSVFDDHFSPAAAEVVK